MITKNFIVQFLSIALAIGIVFTYIKPTLGDIRLTQDKIADYTEEVNQVSEVNALLASLVNTAEGISGEDRTALNRFMPNNVDELAVMKDIEIIADQSGLIISDLVYDGEVSYNSEQSPSAQNNEAFVPMVHEFIFEFSSTYDQLKIALTLMEMNDYVLQIADLNITPNGNDFVTAKLTLHAFSLTNFNDTSNTN